jgi:diguanylate cyclase (GGDEF)-like protein
MTAATDAASPVEPARPGRAIDRVPVALVRFTGGTGAVEVLEANDRAAVLLATTVGELVGSGLVSGLSADDATRLATALRHPDDAPVEIIVHRGTAPVRVLGVGVQRDVDGSVLAALCDRTPPPSDGTAADASTHNALQRTQQELWTLANRDQLTGLPNRTSCYDRLEQALARSRREARPTAVLYCEVNNIRQVNDQLGHAAGDTLLVEIARRFTSSVRETDTVCRFGGDEFVVVCEGFDDLAGIEALTRRLIDITRTTVDLGDASATAGLCVGIAVARAGSTRDQLLSSAETAGHQAKENGRNTYVIAAHPS